MDDSSIYFITGAQKVISHGRQHMVAYKVQPNGKNVQMHIRDIPELKGLFSQYSHNHRGDGAFVEPIEYVLPIDGNQFASITCFAILIDDGLYRVDLREYGVYFALTVDFGKQNGWIN